MPSATLALLALLQAGCATGPGKTGVLPFYESGAAEGEQEWVIRPLWYHREKPAAEYSETQFLWPLGFQRREGKESVLRLLPLFQNTVRIDHLGYEDRDFFVFPIWFQGWSIDEGGYFALFPFGGTMKGYLGKDEITIWGFPAYARLVDAEQVSTHYLWPIVNRVTGEGWDGFRVFPFYGRYRHSDIEGRPVFDRRFYLWPFVHLHENNINSASPAKTFFVFPFYGRVSSDNVDRITWLFPLFKYVADRTNKRAELRCPYPLAVFGWSLDPQADPFVKRDFWPLFGYRRSERYYRRFILSPIERFERYEDDDYLNQRHWILPLWWSYRKLDKATGRGRREWRLYPLVRYRQQADGSTEVYAPSIEWFKDTFGFEKIWAPLWHIYHYQYDGPSGRSWSQLLWGIYRSWDDPASGGGYSVLGGFWDAEYDAQGNRSRRILWFLAPRGDG